MTQLTQAKESGRIYGGESAAERLARQRRQFMDAGLELFGTVGYRATTVRMLCRQAGLIDRYFYKNFRDTEDLLAAVYTESLDEIEAVVVQAIRPYLDAAGTTWPVEVGLEAFFAAFENSRAARVCWLEVLGVSPAIDRLYTDRIQQFAALLLSICKSLSPTWHLSDDEARVTSIALIGSISQSAMFWLLDGYKSPRATLVAANTRLLRGVVHMLAQGA